MDNIHKKCNNVTNEYKEKYKKLISLVEGYEKANDTQNENLKNLSSIISNTKELISESDFNKLKNEQHNIMEDFYKLESMKDNPYSNNSLDFTNDQQNNNQEDRSQNKLSQILKKQYSIQDLKEIEKQKKNIDKEANDQEIKKNNVVQNLSPNYKVVSSDYHNLPNIPSIQIVNVQEAPHINQKPEEKKN